MEEVTEGRPKFELERLMLVGMKQHQRAYLRPWPTTTREQRPLLLVPERKRQSEHHRSRLYPVGKPSKRRNQSNLRQTVTKAKGPPPFGL